MRFAFPMRRIASSLTAARAFQAGPRQARALPRFSFQLPIPHVQSHRKVLLLTLAALVLTARVIVRAEDAAPSEYQLKAAFLYNFAKFVEWPPQAFANDATVFTIGVIGEDPFGEELERMVKHKNLNGRPFAVKQVKTLSELKSCHILFI